MNRVKRIAALVGAVLLVLLYLLTLVCALLQTENWYRLFEASLFCTIGLPIVLYAMTLVYKVLHKDDV